MTRLADTLDAASALVPLVQQRPWARQTGKRQERFQDGRWQSIQPADRLRVCQPEAQVSCFLKICNGVAPQVIHVPA